MKKCFVIFCIAVAHLAVSCGSRRAPDATNQRYATVCETTRQLAKDGRYDEAIRLLRPYAEKGLPAAQFDIALGMVLKGDTNDNSEIVIWVRKAALQDYPQALGFLANAYRWGEYGLPTNNVIAKMWDSSRTNAS